MPYFRTANLILLAIAAGAVMPAQETSTPDDPARVGVPRDWSHRHQIFTQAENFDRLSEIQLDARFWHQVYNQTTRTIEGPARNHASKSPVRLSPMAVGKSALDALPTPDEPAVDWGESMGTAGLTFTNLNSYPAKYSFNVANPVPSCTGDYVVFTLPTPTTTRFNVVAFKNLYVNNAGTGSCPGTKPQILFAYNASQNGGSMTSSPSLSLDGKQIAVIENAAAAQFHVIKWRAGDVSTTFGNPYNAAKMVNCATNGAVAPCEWNVVYSTGRATLSAPFIDYATDTAYVSDDIGKVYSIKPVFGGGQPVVTSTVAIAGSTTMTPPVYDSVSKNVFVADGTGKLYYIRTSAASAGTCISGSAPCQGSTTLTVATGAAVIEAPTVDSTNGKVYVYSRSAPTAGNSSVVQAGTTLAGASVATIGPSGTQIVYGGAFSNNYYTSPATGMLYVCGTNAANIPQLYGISFTGTTMNAGGAAKGPLSLATATAACGPVTEVFNQSTSKDELYLSVSTRCTTGITGGCMRRFDITAGFPSAATNTVAEAGGTMGIIVDNVKNNLNGNDAETNIYFVTRSAQSCSKHTDGTATATSNCAVKLTQSALQ